VSKSKSILSAPLDAPLTEKQELLVELQARGASQTAAGKAVYGANGAIVATNTMKDPRVTAALANARNANALNLGLTRDDVLQGMMDAIDQAKLVCDPAAQIVGWREIAKVCGFYAPEVKKIELTGAARRVIDRLQQLSDRELLEIMNAEDATVIEASDAGTAS
jgi:hypothetical protein